MKAFIVVTVVLLCVLVAVLIGRGVSWLAYQRDEHERQERGKDESFHEKKVCRVYPLFLRRAIPCFSIRA